MKLLFIDDEQTFLKYLVKRMKLEGFEVKTTFSGEEGIQAVVKEDFDVAVVDLKMPGIDGIEVQRRLKEIQPNLPCIVLSGHASFENALESGKHNAFKFLSKPVDMKTLIETIQAAYEHRMGAENDNGNKIVQEPASKKEGIIAKFYNKLQRVYNVDQ